MTNPGGAQPSDPQGIYVHIPFCDGKCPYCDFYSVSAPHGNEGERLKDSYLEAVLREIDEFTREHAADREISVDTVYFGGGTPLLLGAERLCVILNRLGRRFRLNSGCEMTVEVNPRSSPLKDLLVLRRSGFSRLSIGAQSAENAELAALGRRHGREDIAKVFRDARSVGFDNISLDLMLAVPKQDKASLARTVEFYSELSPEHISAYILKIEPETPFGRMDPPPEIPDDDGQAELYLEACRLLGREGYKQYEISNFCREGRESRHNLRYWRCEEYIGFGAAAHGFYGGRRYYHPRDIGRYIEQNVTVDDGPGGGRAEYMMLALRLSEGLTESGWRSRYSGPIPRAVREKAEIYRKAGLLVSDVQGIRLTRNGFLVSNYIISELTEPLDGE